MKKNMQLTTVMLAGFVLLELTSCKPAEPTKEKTLDILMDACQKLTGLDNVHYTKKETIAADGQTTSQRWDTFFDISTGNSCVTALIDETVFYETLNYNENYYQKRYSPADEPWQQAEADDSVSSFWKSQTTGSYTADDFVKLEYENSERNIRIEAVLSEQALQKKKDTALSDYRLAITEATEYPDTFPEETIDDMKAAQELCALQLEQTEYLNGTIIFEIFKDGMIKEVRQSFTTKQPDIIQTAEGEMELGEKQEYNWSVDFIVENYNDAEINSKIKETYDQCIIEISQQ